MSYTLQITLIWVQVIAIPTIGVGALLLTYAWYFGERRPSIANPRIAAAIFATGCCLQAVSVIALRLMS